MVARQFQGRLRGRKIRPVRRHRTRAGNPRLAGFSRRRRRRRVGFAGAIAGIFRHARQNPFHRHAAIEPDSGRRRARYSFLRRPSCRHRAGSPDAVGRRARHSIHRQAHRAHERHGKCSLRCRVFGRICSRSGSRGRRGPRRRSSKQANASAIECDGVWSAPELTVTKLTARQGGWAPGWTAQNFEAAATLTAPANVTTILIRPGRGGPTCSRIGWPGRRGWRN